ncbi:hypothetical protein K501DRAFT_279714 [Backusella circina FSU 941]|nr:hypothetical protein K501DRAFT_279714 [Backusella circina FSU 941]
MSGSNTSPPFILHNTTTSDFTEYLLHERAKSIPVAPYDLQQSLRIWLKNFEQQAALHGISNFNTYCMHIGRYLPPIIQQWIPTQPPEIVTRWSLLTESFLVRFGLPEEEDNRRLLRDLRKCKKSPNESVKLHAAKWEHKLSLIFEKYTEKIKMSYFIESLDQRDTRLTLTALVAALQLDSIAQVINQAITLEYDAKLLDSPERRGNYHKGHKTTGDYRNNKKTQLRAYDKYGNPICDYCHAKNRTMDCKESSSDNTTYHKNRSYNLKHTKKFSSSKGQARRINNLEVYSSDNDTRKIGSSKVTPISVDIAHLTNFKRVSLSRSRLSINKIMFMALWDTGAQISGISKDAAIKMDVFIDTTRSVQYRDVNGNIKSACGLAQLSMGNVPLQGLIDAKNHKITLNVDNKKVVLHTLQDKSVINAIDIQNKDTERITNLILAEFKDVVADNPNKPSVTHLVEFEIDTDDHRPVFEKPRTFHPQLE